MRVSFMRLWAPELVGRGLLAAQHTKQNTSLKKKKRFQVERALAGVSCFQSELRRSAELWASSGLDRFVCTGPGLLATGLHTLLISTIVTIVYWGYIGFIGLHWVVFPKLPIII